MANEETDKAGVTRRSALGVLAGAIVAVGCGGSNEADATPGSGGASGGGGAPGGGTSSGGTSSGGASSGGTSSGGTSSGGSAGSAGSSSGGQAGASGLDCHQSGPTPGCKITDDNILGPYYKAGAPYRADITDGQVGTVLIVEGTVYGCDCVTPLGGAVVDVWQANDAGAYDNQGYVLRGKMVTDEQGRYELHTILPGFYLNGSTYRPRHVHYKVSHPDGTALTTQLYFEGDPYIPVDPFVKASLVMPFVEETNANGDKQYRVKFDVILA